MTCWVCGQRGHVSRNCPHAQNGATSGGNAQTTSGSMTGPSVAGPSGTAGSGGESRRQRRKPPQQGQPHQRSINGVTHFWCNRCRLWNRSHTTERHVSRPRTEGPHQASGNVAESNPTTVLSSPTTVVPQTRFMAALQQAMRNQNE